MAESLIAHEPVIDHLTWPKLRERLMSSQTDMLTNKFWTFFARNMRVVGDFEPFEVVAYSPKSSMYQLTDRFEYGLMDMANWRMDINFFYEFPGLANDVPPVNYMPLMQLTPRFGLVERNLLQQHQQRQQQSHPQHLRYAQHQVIHQQRRPTIPSEMSVSGTHMPTEAAMYGTSGSVPWTGFYS